VNAEPSHPFLLVDNPKDPVAKEVLYFLRFSGVLRAPTIAPVSSMTSRPQVSREETVTGIQSKAQQYYGSYPYAALLGKLLQHKTFFGSGAVHPRRRSSAKPGSPQIPAQMAPRPHGKGKTWRCIR
jgi:hypothetical protein